VPKSNSHSAPQPYTNQSLLNCTSEIYLSRNAKGREFQRQGPATEKFRDAFVFFLWHTSRRQLIAVIGGRCRSRADNHQPGTVEAGRVTLCAQEHLNWSDKDEWKFTRKFVRLLRKKQTN